MQAEAAARQCDTEEDLWKRRQDVPKMADSNIPVNYKFPKLKVEEFNFATLNVDGVSVLACSRALGGCLMSV